MIPRSAMAAEVVKIERNPQGGRYAVELSMYGMARLVLYSVHRDDLPRLGDQYTVTIEPS